MTHERASVVAVAPDHGIEGKWTQRAAVPGECELVFDGWLVGREQLTKELGLEPDASRSDAELALSAYRRWSIPGCARLRGGFALVLWDERDKTAFAVRDQLGVHPLFRAQARDVHLFSPSLDSLADDPRVSREPDTAALVGLLAPSLPFQDETPYRAVRRVPQGCLCAISSSGARVSRYWDPAPEDATPGWVTSDDLGCFDSLLQRAVERCLALGDPAIYLSGGLDSVAVAALASDLVAAKSRRPVALSLAFPGPDIDERRVQASVAKTLRLPHVLLGLDDAVGSKGVLGAAIELAAEWPSPLQNPWLPAYRRLTQEAVARGYETILTGGGGDEWLTANPFWAADLMRSMRLVELMRFALNYRRSYHLADRYVLRNVFWRFGLRPLLVDAASRRAPALAARHRLERRLARVPTWLPRDAETRRILADRLGARRSELRYESVYIREMRSAVDHPLMDLEMEEVYEAGRRDGVRLVQPFWDADLVAFLYRVPPDLLNRGGRSKGLVRDLLDRRFPSCGFQQQRKVVTTAFFVGTMLREGRAAKAALGPVRTLDQLGVVDAEAVDRDLERVLATHDGSGAHRIWSILSLEAWARTHL